MEDRMIRVVGILMDAFPQLIQAAIMFTVPLTLISFALGMVLAFGTALARLSTSRVLSKMAEAYVWIIRGTPLLVQLFIIFYGLPSAGITIGAFPSAVIGFTLSVGAYNSETIRAAILSVDRGQWEAAHVLGLGKRHALIHIILPQAMRVAVPPLSNAFISLVKDTSLAAAVTVTELFQVAQQVTARTYEPLWLYTEAALIYLFFSTLLGQLQSKLEIHFSQHLG